MKFLQSKKQRFTKMDESVFLSKIDNQLSKDFTQKFGGYFIIDYCEGCVYCFENDVYEITDNFEELMNKSIDTGKNLLLSLKKLNIKSTKK